MVHMTRLSANDILNNVKRRFQRGVIYTNVADILISVNPYRDLGLYSDEVLDEYSYSALAGSTSSSSVASDARSPATMASTGLHRNTPHIFSLARDAYSSMMFALRQQEIPEEDDEESQQQEPEEMKNGGSGARRGLHIDVNRRGRAGVKANQSVLISGESGAGKTEATKLILRYVTRMSAAQHKNPDSPSRLAAAATADEMQQLADLEQKLLLAGPVLESFGNARTVFNDNSSRFGKWMAVNFDGLGIVRSASLTKYLLEETRVCSHAEGESNFHIFYQLCAASCRNAALTVNSIDDNEVEEDAALTWGDFESSSDDEDEDEDDTNENAEIGAHIRMKAKRFAILRASPAFMLSESSVSVTSKDKDAKGGKWAHSGGKRMLSRQPAPEDAPEYSKTVASMQALGFSTEDVRDVMSVVRAIMHLGNVVLVPQKGKEDTVVVLRHKSERQDPLVRAATEMGVRTEDLESCLTMKRFYSPSGSFILIPLKLSQAEHTRDSLLKSMYGRLFDSIIAQINKCLASPSATPFEQQDPFETVAPSTRPVATIGLLDIFGFELFEQNHFEQLCINYANEKLQQFFIQKIFKLEQNLYIAEGIDIGSFRYSDNADCLHLFENSKITKTDVLGLFPLLDEELRLPKGSDKALWQKIVDSLQGKPKFKKDKVSRLQPRGQRQHPRDMLSFIVCHYPEEVTYSCKGFMAKNRHKLSPDLMDLCRASNRAYVASLYASTSDGGASAADNSATATATPTSTTSSSSSSSSHKRSSSKSNIRSPKPFASKKSAKPTSSDFKISSAAQFRAQMSELLGVLSSTTPHFLRCIKPNNSKTPEDLEDELVERQLRTSGMMDAVWIRNRGYEHRMSQVRFARLYSRVLVVKEKRRLREKFTETHGVANPDLSMPEFVRATCELILQKISKKLAVVNQHKPTDKVGFYQLSKKRDAESGAKDKKGRRTVSENNKHAADVERSLRALWTLGHTKVFFQRDLYEWLEIARSEFAARRRRSVLPIQSAYRGFAVRKFLGPVVTLWKRACHALTASMSNQFTPPADDDEEVASSNAKAADKLEADDVAQIKELDSLIDQLQESMSKIPRRVLVTDGDEDVGDGGGGLGTTAIGRLLEHSLDVIERQRTSLFRIAQVRHQLHRAVAISPSALEAEEDLEDEMPVHTAQERIDILAFALSEAKHLDEDVVMRVPECHIYTSNPLLHEAKDGDGKVIRRYFGMLGNTNEFLRAQGAHDTLLRVNEWMNGPLLHFERSAKKTEQVKELIAEVDKLDIGSILEIEDARQLLSQSVSSAIAAASVETAVNKTSTTTTTGDKLVEEKNSASSAIENERSADLSFDMDMQGPVSPEQQEALGRMHTAIDRASPLVIKLNTNASLSEQLMDDFDQDVFEMVSADISIITDSVISRERSELKKVIRDAENVLPCSLSGFETALTQLQSLLAHIIAFIDSRRSVMNALREAIREGSRFAFSDYYDTPAGDDEKGGSSSHYVLEADLVAMRDRLNKCMCLCIVSGVPKPHLSEAQDTLEELDDYVVRRSEALDETAKVAKMVKSVHFAHPQVSTMEEQAIEKELETLKRYESSSHSTGQTRRDQEEDPQLTSVVRVLRACVSDCDMVGLGNDPVVVQLRDSLQRLIAYIKFRSTCRSVLHTFAHMTVQQFQSVNHSHADLLLNCCLKIGLDSGTGQHSSHTDSKTVRYLARVKKYMASKEAVVEIMVSRQKAESKTASDDGYASDDSVSKLDVVEISHKVRYLSRELTAAMKEQDVDWLASVVKRGQRLSSTLELLMSSSSQSAVHSSTRDMAEHLASQLKVAVFTEKQMRKEAEKGASGAGKKNHARASSSLSGHGTWSSPVKVKKSKSRASLSSALFAPPPGVEMGDMEDGSERPSSASSNRGASKTPTSSASTPTHASGKVSRSSSSRDLSVTQPLRMPASNGPVKARHSRNASSSRALDQAASTEKQRKSNRTGITSPTPKGRSHRRTTSSSSSNAPLSRQGSNVSRTSKSVASSTSRTSMKSSKSNLSTSTSNGKVSRSPSNSSLQQKRPSPKDSPSSKSHSSSKGQASATVLSPSAASASNKKLDFVEDSDEDWDDAFGDDDDEDTSLSNVATSQATSKPSSRASAPSSAATSTSKKSKKLEADLEDWLDDSDDEDVPAKAKLVPYESKYQYTSDGKAIKKSDPQVAPLGFETDVGSPIKPVRGQHKKNKSSSSSRSSTMNRGDSSSSLSSSHRRDNSGSSAGSFQSPVPGAGAKKQQANPLLPSLENKDDDGTRLWKRMQAGLDHRRSSLRKSSVHLNGTKTWSKSMFKSIVNERGKLPFDDADLSNLSEDPSMLPPTHGKRAHRRGEPSVSSLNSSFTKPRAHHNRSVSSVSIVSQPGHLSSTRTPNTGSSSMDSKLDELSAWDSDSDDGSVPSREPGEVSMASETMDRVGPLENGRQRPSMSFLHLPRRSRSYSAIAENLTVQEEALRVAAERHRLMEIRRQAILDLQNAECPLSAFNQINPVKGGWLWKQGQRYRTWNKRLFVLEGKYLHYYGDIRDRQPKGVVDLTSCEVAEEVEISEARNVYCFSVFAYKGWNVSLKRNFNERKYFFYTDTFTDMSEWMSIISKTGRWYSLPDIEVMADKDSTKRFSFLV